MLFNQVFMFKIKAKDGKARTGVLKTRNGEIETPFFMPVATKTAVKYLDPRDLEEIGVKAVIANSLVLFFRPGADIIKKAGGIQKFMNFKGSVFTDSGGFQKMRESFQTKIKNDGIIFKSPFDGKDYLITPEKAMKIQEELKSDIAMALDDMPLYGSSKKKVELSVSRTHRWAEECLKYHKDKKQLLFGIAQGGVFKDLREKSAKFIGELDFEGVAFGGLAIGESSKETREMINLSVKHFPENKVRYLMGVGNPKQMIEAISYGVDCFDSTFPTQNARHATLFTSKGNLSIMNSKYKDDLRALDENCDCYVCKNYSRAHIRHLMKMKEANGLRYCTYHNIYFINNMMKEIRKAIKEKRFDKFKKEFLKNKINLL